MSTVLRQGCSVLPAHGPLRYGCRWLGPAACRRRLHVRVRTVLRFGAVVAASSAPTSTEPPTQTPAPQTDAPSAARYWIQFPDQMQQSGFGGAVELSTNLPDGTLFASTSTTSQGSCCPAVHNGSIRVQLDNESCYGVVGEAADAGPVGITITVAPNPSDSSTMPDDRLPQQQPSNVIEKLGPRLEKLNGEQVQSLPSGGKELVATHTYDWPTPQCGGPLPFFGGPTCPAAPEQLQGDSFDQAMVEVVGAIGQARMCEFWGTDLTEAMEQLSDPDAPAPARIDADPELKATYGRLRASIPELIGALAPVAELFALKGSAGDALTAAVSSRGFLNTKQQPGQGGGVDG